MKKRGRNYFSVTIIEQDVGSRSYIVHDLFDAMNDGVRVN